MVDFFIFHIIVHYFNFSFNILNHSVNSFIFINKMKLCAAMNSRYRYRQWINNKLLRNFRYSNCMKRAHSCQNRISATSCTCKTPLKKVYKEVRQIREFPTFKRQLQSTTHLQTLCKLPRQSALNATNSQQERQATSRITSKTEESGGRWETPTKRFYMSAVHMRVMQLRWSQKIESCATSKLSVRIGARGADRDAPEDRGWEFRQFSRNIRDRRTPRSFTSCTQRGRTYRGITEDRSKKRLLLGRGCGEERTCTAGQPRYRRAYFRNTVRDSARTDANWTGKNRIAGLLYQNILRFADACDPLAMRKSPR